MIVNGVECYGIVRSPIEGDPGFGEIATNDTEFGSSVVVGIDEHGTFQESIHCGPNTWSDAYVNPTFGQAGHKITGKPFVSIRELMLQDSESEYVQDKKEK